MGKKTKKGAVLIFPKGKIEKPLISHVIRHYDMEVNILSAQITPQEDGRMFAIFSGSKDAVDMALNWLKENGVEVTVPKSIIMWHADKCTHCGACVGQCPSLAFRVNPTTFETMFDSDKCLECKRCVLSCCYQAIELVSENLLREGNEQ